MKYEVTFYVHAPIMSSQFHNEKFRNPTAFDDVETSCSCEIKARVHSHLYR